ncbi:MAG TPA: cytochrome c oxidase subunit II [Bryobacteraceae bacterium]|nr:cytochrome c oxidase subunit II [Bryobacteraceae bacterium]
MFFAALIWLTALLVAASFAVKRWWFPAAINAHAVAFDSYFSMNLILMGGIFLGAQAALGWFIWRYRDRGQKVLHHEGSNRLEIFWTSVTLILFVSAAIASAGLWSDVHLNLLSSAAMRVELSGKQFAWNVRYPGPDGKFGRTDIRLMNDASGNPFGIDPKDAAGKDDIVSSALRIPAATPVTLLLHTHDVIHNFFVRELRIKQDLVPGMEIPLKIQADKPGEYEVACSELCGLGHHQMRSVMIVMPPSEFEAWLRQQN